MGDDSKDMMRREGEVARVALLAGMALVELDRASARNGKRVAEALLTVLERASRGEQAEAAHNAHRILVAAQGEYADEEGEGL